MPKEQYLGAKEHSSIVLKVTIEKVQISKHANNNLILIGSCKTPENLDPKQLHNNGSFFLAEKCLIKAQDIIHLLNKTGILKRKEQNIKICNKDYRKIPQSVKNQDSPLGFEKSYR